MFSVLRTIVLVTFIGILTDACEPNQTCEVNLLDENVKALIAGFEKFTNDLMIGLYTNPNMKGNVQFSPISIYASLATMLFGSKTQTLDELVAALGFPQTDLQQLQGVLGTILQALEVRRTQTDAQSNEFVYEEVVLAQSVFLEQGLTLVDAYRDFLEVIGAEHFTVDFANNGEAAKNTINEWASKHTGKLVTAGIASPLPANTKVLLANTVYFSGKWEQNFFNKDNSGPGKFFSPAAERDIETMTTTKTLPYYTAASYSAIQLPYQGADYVMIVVLPNNNIQPQDFVKTFTIDEYKKIIKESSPGLIRCTLPKFDSVWSGTLSEYLRALKINTMFDDGADLGNMIQNINGGLSSAEVIHATGMKINEDGTIATSITLVEGFATSLMQLAENDPTPFIVDRPYLMFIYHLQTSIPIYATYIRDL